MPCRQLRPSSRREHVNASKGREGVEKDGREGERDGRGGNEREEERKDEEGVGKERGSIEREIMWSEKDGRGREGKGNRRYR